MCFDCFLVVQAPELEWIPKARSFPESAGGLQKTLPKRFTILEIIRDDPIVACGKSYASAIQG